MPLSCALVGLFVLIWSYIGLSGLVVELDLVVCLCGPRFGRGFGHTLVDFELALVGFCVDLV